MSGTSTSVTVWIGDDATLHVYRGRRRRQAVVVDLWADAAMPTMYLTESAAWTLAANLARVLQAVDA